MDDINHINVHVYGNFDSLLEPSQILPGITETHLRVGAGTLQVLLNSFNATLLTRENDGWIVYEVVVCMINGYKWCFSKVQFHTQDSENGLLPAARLCF